MRTIDELKRLESILEDPPLPRAITEWDGADVVITDKVTDKEKGGGFYPEPRYIITSHSLELSWLFEGLRDAFYAEERLDGSSKIEFFGRLANAANRCIRNSPTVSPNFLLSAVLHEAFVVYDEMEKGTFKYLGVAVGNEIADDHINNDPRTG